METREKRICLRLSAKSEAQRRALNKMDSYDKCRYSSLTDYIVQAILAYKEPIITGEEQLRRVLREELSRNRGKMPVPAAKNHELQIRDTQERDRKSVV